MDGGYAYHAIDSLKIRKYEVNYNSPSSYERNLLSSYLNFKHSFLKFDYSSVTSYSFTKDNQFLDADFTYWDVFSNNKRSKQHQITQELNLQSKNDNNIQWTSGIFAFYKNLKNNYIARFGVDREKLMPIDLDSTLYYNNVKTIGLAAYGQISYDNIWPNANISFGLRYDYEKADLRYYDNLYKGNMVSEKYHDLDESESFNAFLPKLSLLQKFDNTSLYLGVAKGYKAGGYNIISNEMSTQVIDLKYDEEKLWNFEIGLKYFSHNSKFNINSAIYFIDWKDQQIFVMGMMGPSIKNAGDAHSYGAETDITLVLNKYFTWNMSGGYTNAKYYRHDTKEYEGNRVVMAPEFTINTSINYHREINWSIFESISGRISINTFGTQYFNEANDLKQNPYILTNADFGIKSKHFSISIWAKNIFDKHYFSYMLNSPVGKNLPEYYKTGQPAEPFKCGITINFSL